MKTKVKKDKKLELNANSESDLKEEINSELDLIKCELSGLIMSNYKLNEEIERLKYKHNELKKITVTNSISGIIALVLILLIFSL